MSTIESTLEARKCGKMIICFENYNAILTLMTKSYCDTLV